MKKKDIKKFPCLNLGCGFDYDPNYTNIDVDDKQFQVDLKFDLEIAKLPYEDNSIEIVKACHILEHIQNYISLMKEIHRVLKNDGVLYIRVPEFGCAAAIADPTHVRFFVPESFYLWTDNRPPGADTGNIANLFSLEWIESVKHNSGMPDRGVPGRWFTEIECELTAIKDRANNENSVST